MNFSLKEAHENEARRSVAKVSGALSRTKGRLFCAVGNRKALETAD